MIMESRIFNLVFRALELQPSVSLPLQKSLLYPFDIGLVGPIATSDSAKKIMVSPYARNVTLIS